MIASGYIALSPPGRGEGEGERCIKLFRTEAQWKQLPDDVERGETIIITRDGRPIARLIPELVRRKKSIDEALTSLKELRQRAGKITREELLSARHQDHRY